MSRSDDQRIADVLEAAEQLSVLVADGHETFVGDWVRQRAAERLLEIIGEASNAISEEARATNPEVPWRHIVNLRHLLAHHYHRIDVEQIWTIATVSVPELVEHLAVEADGTDDG